MLGRYVWKKIVGQMKFYHAEVDGDASYVVIVDPENNHHLAKVLIDDSVEKLKCNDVSQIILDDWSEICTEWMIKCHNVSEEKANSLILDLMVKVEQKNIFTDARNEITELLNEYLGLGLSKSELKKIIQDAEF